MKFLEFPHCELLPQFSPLDFFFFFAVDRMDRGHGGLSRDEFEKICADQKARDFSSTFKKKLSKKENVEQIGGMSEASRYV